MQLIKLKEVSVIDFKKILIVSLVLITLFSITSVSASDGNDSAGSFRELQELIDESSDESVLNLTKDYTYTNESTKGILINKEITINGNNHVLNGKFKSRIFYIDNPMVILNNITFVNGVGSDRIVNYEKGYFIENNGGAVLNMAGELVNACTFINNSADNGGALYMENGRVTNCKFINNTAKTWKYSESETLGGYGGAFKGTLVDVENSTFINNHGHFGGAITSDINSILNSAFINNTAYDGGAIYVYAYYVEINNSQFMNNHADNKGGAVYLEDSKLENSLFIGNSAKLGGAVYQQSGDINNNTFENNAAHYGGAIYHKKGKLDNNTFKNNTAKYEGDDIYYHNSSKDNNQTNNQTPDDFKSNMTSENNFNSNDYKKIKETGNPIALLLISIILPISRKLKK